MAFYSFHHTLFGEPERGFIRIPVWGHIPLSTPLKAVLSHPTFLRLKGVRQLSFAHHVFPGATHTRFEHSIGVYHLTKLILERVVQTPLSATLTGSDFEFTDEACRLILASALLHDLGHYPHAHIVERIPLTMTDEVLFEDHQDLTRHFLFESHDGAVPLAEIMSSMWRIDPDRLVRMIEGTTPMPHAKLISGTLDPDKMDYLMRDAHHCNIPYGEIDIHRLIESFVPDAARRRLAITEKGVAPLESLIFAKYMMMRNVYWHHTTRTFAVMLKRLIQDAVDLGAVRGEQLETIFYPNSDDGLLRELKSLLGGIEAIMDLLDGLIRRRPYKRLATLPLRFFSASFLERFSQSAAARKRLETALTHTLLSGRGKALRGNEVLLDMPSRKTIFDVKDFLQLQLYREAAPGDEGGFTPFTRSGVSAFTEAFISSFEHSSRSVTVLISPQCSGLIALSPEEIAARLEALATDVGSSAHG